MRAISSLARLVRSSRLRVGRAVVDRVARQRWASAGLAARTAEVGGVPVAYLERPGPEPRLALLHGFGGTKDGWVPLAAALGGGRRLLAPDLAGHGDSLAEPGAHYDALRYAADVAAWLDALGAGPVDLCGNSLGGLLATAVALSRPDLVRSLVLLAPAGVPSPTPSRLDEMTAEGLNPLVPTTPTEYRRMLDVVFTRPPDLPGFAADVLAERAAGRAPFLRDLFANLLASGESVLDRLPEVRAPALIVWGADDRVLDVSSAPLWAEALPDARLAVLDGVGHVPMMEAPEATARLVRDFLDAQ